MLQQHGYDALGKGVREQCAGKCFLSCWDAKQDLGFPVLVERRTSRSPTQAAFLDTYSVNLPEIDESLLML